MLGDTKLGVRSCELYPKPNCQKCTLTSAYIGAIILTTFAGL